MHCVSISTVRGRILRVCSWQLLVCFDCPTWSLPRTCKTSKSTKVRTAETVGIGCSRRLSHLVEAQFSLCVSFSFCRDSGRRAGGMQTVRDSAASGDSTARRWCWTSVCRIWRTDGGFRSRAGACRAPFRSANGGRGIFRRKRLCCRATRVRAWNKSVLPLGNIENNRTLVIGLQ